MLIGLCVVLVLSAGCKVTVGTGTGTGTGTGNGNVGSGGGGTSCGQQNSPFYQDAVSALGVLRSDSQWQGGALSDDVAAFASDAKEASSDLTATRHDAKGDNAGCSAVSNAADDAENIQDDTTVGEDENTLSEQISRIQRDIDQLQNYDRELKRPLAGAASAISTAKSNLAHAITLANSGIATVNSADRAAYVLVDGIAKGDCSADAPGPVPPPYAAIRT
jgi:hypothetical protein